jgi:hypothetical protein
MAKYLRVDGDFATHQLPDDTDLTALSKRLRAAMDEGRSAAVDVGREGESRGIIIVTGRTVRSVLLFEGEPVAGHLSSPLRGTVGSERGIIIVSG